MSKDLEQRLDRLWKAISRLEHECKIDFSKLNSIPELDFNKDGIAVVDAKKRSMIFKRLKLFKSLEAYMHMLETCELLGVHVKRNSRTGRHSL